ncbi:lanthionine synthetase C family protein [Streptomyces anthocyanicus]|uniref:Lanthionine biosynthesis cyclase LanC n=1 Tax=Streptomyces lividans 1326 TaxID=1200984 RepID=A0A7U9DQ27_STRLI|nr:MULTISPECIES: lanthionine synthetase C family protein [Streptomyces]EOY45636.1 Lanthionine biosynthesis cyclase LanC [Streptomyces lividans 1326]KKD13932.1 Lanthionine biosynthesis cyclase LanC [Streptomyces sp. WM6391]
MNLRDSARVAADTIAERLASPQDVRGLHHRQGWWPQSLAHGAVGVALLHIERARTELGPWQRAHDWLACAATEPAVGGPDSHLYYGAPALTFALHAAADRPGRYARALDTLDRYVTKAIRDRLADAHARMDRGEMPALAEFDAIRGLSGLGGLLLHRDVHADVLREILTYLVRLTEPVKHDGEVLPGWWSHLAPSGTISPQYPEGHANNGVAHGIGGPLAVLSLAARRGVTVDGHLDAITRILAWLDHWQQDSPAGPWWPYWITREQLRSGTTGPGPFRPSWCYGTAGFARTQQLAALALKDPARQHAAEFALLRAMTDPGQLDAIVDVSLCHGFAGLARVTQLAAADALAPGLAECLPRLLAPITDTAPGTLADSVIAPPGGGDIGLLEGAAGTALALNAFHTGAPSASGWDICFLIN